MKWDTSDSARFREYHKKSGGKLLTLLQQSIPVTNGRTIEEVALQAKYKEGCEFIVNRLLQILSDENKSDDASSASYASM